MDFQEITAECSEVVRIPVNTTAMFQLKLVISSIETSGNSVPSSGTQTHAHKYTKEVPHDIKYQENAGSFKESDCWNKWLFKYSLNHSAAQLLWKFKSNIFKIIYSMQTSNIISVIVVIIVILFNSNFK